ncbi:transcription factor SOX-6 isoform X1, partial [Tachysurus ichikawai]
MTFNIVAGLVNDRVSLCVEYDMTPSLIGAESDTTKGKTRPRRHGVYILTHAKDGNQDRVHFESLGHHLGKLGDDGKIGQRVIDLTRPEDLDGKFFFFFLHSYKVVLCLPLLPEVYFSAPASDSRVRR